jgi:protein-S-isoprenylcysteine O-methyltransferase Ste14
MNVLLIILMVVAIASIAFNIIIKIFSIVIHAIAAKKEEEILSQ